MGCSKFRLLPLARSVSHSLPLALTFASGFSPKHIFMTHSVYGYALSLGLHWSPAPAFFPNPGKILPEPDAIAGC